MSTTRRVFALMLLVLSFVSIGGGSLIAQQQQPQPQPPTSKQATPTSVVLVPIAGMADAGSMFAGTFALQRFEGQSNAVVAVGTVSGELSDATGVTRNVVTQVKLPLDVNASLARRNTDPAIAQASCGPLHLEFSTSSVNMLNSTFAFAPASVDIVATSQLAAPSGQPAAPNGQPANPSGQPQTGSGDLQIVNGQPTIGSSRPGPAQAPSPQPVQPPATDTDLSSVLCSADLSTAANSQRDLVRLLNQILAAL